MTQDTSNKVNQYFDENDISYQHWGKDEMSYPLHYGYRDSVELSHHDTLLRMNEILARSTTLKPGAKMLDAGCGVGATCVWFYQNQKAVVYGISSNERHISKARNYANLNSLDINYSVQNYSETNFPNNFFDAIIVLESLCYCENKKQFLSESFRILKPNGRLVIADYVLRNQEFTAVESYILDIWFRGWALQSLCVESQFNNELGQVGFVTVDELDITPNIQSSSEEIYKRGKEGYPDDLIAKSKSIIQIEHVQACMFQKVALDLNLWSYRVYCVAKP